MTCKEKIDEIEKILDDEYETKIERIREVVDDEEDKAIPLDKVKKAREEIENEVNFLSEPSKYDAKPVVNARKAKTQSYKHCLEILDKLIESEVG